MTLIVSKNKIGEAKKKLFIYFAFGRKKYKCTIFSRFVYAFVVDNLNNSVNFDDAQSHHQLILVFDANHLVNMIRFDELNLIIAELIAIRL